MKRSSVSIVVLACLVVVLAFVLSSSAVPTASAQIGNSGVIVRCVKPDYWIAVNTTEDLTCYAVDGTSFVNVPAGHYVLVTDVYSSPFGGPATGSWGMDLLVPGSSLYPITPFTYFTGGTYLQHFTTPVIVVKPGEKIQGKNYGSSPTSIMVSVYGLYTTNANYMPLMSK